MNTGYCILFACGIIAGAALFTYSTAKRLKKPAAALLGSVLAVVLGAVLAKLVYYLCQIDFMIAYETPIWSMEPDQWSVFGGASGAVLGVILAARLTKVKPVELLDAFAPAGMLVLAFARAATHFITGEGIGLGTMLEEDSVLNFAPLAVLNEWEEPYLAVYVLETICALVLLAVCVFVFKKDRAQRTVFYLCLTQIMMESLHTDSIRWLFVRSEQLFCMLVIAGIFLYRSLQLRPGKSWFQPIIVCLACAALFVLIEYAVQKPLWYITEPEDIEFLTENAIQLSDTLYFDKCTQNLIVLYVEMFLGLCGLAWIEHLSYRRVKAEAKA